jgi:hypothetical protein
MTRDSTDLATLFSRARAHDAEAVEALANLFETRLLRVAPDSHRPPAPRAAT